MSAPAPTPEVSQRCALIELDQISLLLPQQDLVAIEPVLDVDTRDPEQGVAGWLRIRRQKWPVFCPSDDLEPLAQLLPKRRICAMLAAGRERFGLVCTSVSSIMARDIKPFALPACMPAAAEVIEELATYQGRILCSTTAALLAQALGLRALADYEATSTERTHAGLPV